MELTLHQSLVTIQYYSRWREEKKAKKDTMTYGCLFPKRFSIEDPFYQALTIESRLTVQYFLSENDSAERGSYFPVGWAHRYKKNFAEKLQK